MTDIVERLRAYSKTSEDVVWLPDLHDAADEIERLREALHQQRFFSATRLTYLRQFGTEDEIEQEEFRRDHANAALEDKQ